MLKKQNGLFEQLRRYIKSNVSEDIYGTEIAAVLKNVIAIPREFVTVWDTGIIFKFFSIKCYKRNKTLC